MPLVSDIWASEVLAKGGRLVFFIVVVFGGACTEFLVERRSRAQNDNNGQRHGGVQQSFKGVCYGRHQNNAQYNIHEDLGSEQDQLLGARSSLLHPFIVILLDTGLVHVGSSHEQKDSERDGVLADVGVAFHAKSDIELDEQ